MKPHLAEQTAHERVRRLVCEGLLAHSYQVGDRLPSALELAKQYGVSKMPVIQALQALAQEGVVESLPRKGTYVRRLPGLGAAAQDFAAADSPLAALAGMAKRKTLRVGILADMSEFGHLWRELMLDYMRRQPDVEIELIDLGVAGPEAHPIHDLDVWQLAAADLAQHRAAGNLLNPAEIGGLGIAGDAFPPSLWQGCQAEGTAWGVPLITAVTCEFYHRADAPRLAPLFRATGFWDFIAAAQRLARTLGPTESVYCSSLSLAGLLAQAGLLSPQGRDANHDWQVFRQFLVRYEPYFTNPRLVFPFTLGTSHWVQAFQSFCAGQGLVLNADTSWIPRIQRALPGVWGVQPRVCEPGGHAYVYSNVNCISACTRFPFECADLLRFLASAEAQTWFAERGRVVAHADANRRLRLPGLDDASRVAIAQAIHGGVLYENCANDELEYCRLVGHHELIRWQRGEYDATTLAAQLQQRNHFYRRGRQRQALAGARRAAPQPFVATESLSRAPAR